MSLDTPDADAFEQQAAESIVGDPALRDELTDSEAEHLINWGLAQVTMLAKRAAAQESAEALDDSMKHLRKLMKRINRWVGLRASGDVERLQKELQRLGRISQSLFGDEVSLVDEAVHIAFMKEQATLTNEQIVQQLLAMFAPPWDPRPPLTAPPVPDQLTAPPVPDQLTAPLPPEQITAPDNPDLLPSEGDSSYRE